MRSEVSLDARVPVAHERFVFLYFIIIRSAYLYLFPISPPDLHQQKTKKARVSESLTLLRALWWNTSYACLLFPPNLKTRLHVADRFKFSISREVTTGIASPPVLL